MTLAAEAFDIDLVAAFEVQQGVAQFCQASGGYRTAFTEAVVAHNTADRANGAGGAYRFIPLATKGLYIG